MWEVENNINEKKLDVIKLTLKLNKKKNWPKEDMVKVM